MYLALPRAIFAILTTTLGRFFPNFTPVAMLLHNSITSLQSTHEVWSNGHYNSVLWFVCMSENGSSFTYRPFFMVTSKLGPATDQ